MTHHSANVRPSCCQLQVSLFKVKLSLILCTLFMKILGIIYSQKGHNKPINRSGPTWYHSEGYIERDTLKTFIYSNVAVSVHRS